MNRIPVSSSNVASVGYDDASQVLEIEFLNGFVYQYFDVPRAIYEQLLGADSPGTIVNAVIKPAYRYSRV